MGLDLNQNKIWSGAEWLQQQKSYSCRQEFVMADALLHRGQLFALVLTAPCASALISVNVLQTRFLSVLCHQITMSVRNTSSELWHRRLASAAQMWWTNEAERSENRIQLSNRMKTWRIRVSSGFIHVHGAGASGWIITRRREGNVLERMRSPSPKHRYSPLISPPKTFLVIHLDAEVVSISL